MYNVGLVLRALTIFDTDEVSIIISLPGDQDQPQALLTIPACSFPFAHVSNGDTRRDIQDRMFANDCGCRVLIVPSVATRDDGQILWH